MDLWKQYNTDEIADVYHIAFELRKISGSKSDQYQKEYDIQARARAIKHLIRRLNFDDAQFRELVQNLIPVDVGYCKSRCEENISTLLKWHYYMMIFFAKKGDWLVKAIPLMLKSATLQSDELEAVFNLVLAFNLNQVYGCKQNKAINKTAIDFVKNKRNNKYLYRCVGVIGSLESSPEIKKQIQDIMVEMSRKQNYPGFENSLKSAINIAQDKNPIRNELAKRYEDYGDEQEEELSRISWYKLAQKYYSNQDKKGQIAEKIRRATSNVQLKEFTYKIPNTKFNISGETNFQRACTLVEMFNLAFPKTEDMRQQAKKLQQRFPLASAFSQVNISEVGIPYEVNSKKEIDHAAYVSHFKQTIRLGENMFSDSVQDYEDGRITADDYKSYLDSFMLHDTSVMCLIEHGIKKHYEQDYMSSIHILVPQVEYTLRKMLEQQGVFTTTTSKQNTRYRTLHTLLEKGSQVMGEDLTEFLRLKLTDETGINLRNRVCHGFYEEFPNLENYNPLHEFTHATSLSLILIIMLLTRLSIPRYLQS